MTLPRFAILLSTFNGERFLAAQLDSILAQTDRDWRLYVRDDGSSDATLAILASYAARDSRIAVDPGRNIGVVASFFSLLAAANGQAALFVLSDQDDIWAPDKLAVQAAALAPWADRPALTYSSLRLVDAAGDPLAGQYRVPAAPGLATLIVQNQIPGCTMAINAAAARVVVAGLPPAGQVVMHDWWLLLVVAVVGIIVPTPTPLIDYRQHGANVVGVRTGLAGLRQRIDRVLRQQQGHRLLVQAETLLERHGSALSSQQRRMIESLLATGRGGLARRLRGAFDRSFHRSTRLDDLAFRLLVVAGHYRPREGRNG